jgi:beta-phosphoglucomutase-like phosphatase (HAD superfamily)
VTAVVISDAALGPADTVFGEAVRYLERRLTAVRPLEASALPGDRADAVRALDAWAGTDAANWRLELVRWFEAHAPVHLRPDPVLNATLRQARRRGVRIAVVSPLPPDAAELYLAQLGLRRSVDVVCAEVGDDGRGLAAARLALDEPDAPLIATRAAVDAALRR